MKDLFREAGAIVRADVAMFPDGRPKGTGIVVFETHDDAKNAVAMFNGYNWQESILQVRPVRLTVYVSSWVDKMDIQPLTLYDMCSHS